MVLIAAEVSEVLRQPDQHRAVGSGSADELDGYARELMRLPFRFEVRSPAALRTTLVRLVRGLSRQLDKGTRKNK